MGSLRQRIAERVRSIRWCHSCAAGHRDKCRRSRRRLQLQLDCGHGPDAAEVSGGFGGPLLEHRSRRRNGHHHRHDVPRMPLGCLDWRDLALRSVADLGTRHRHGGVSCGAQSPAFSARGRNRRQREPPASVAAGGLPIGTPVRRPHHRCRRGYPRGRGVGAERLFMDRRDGRELDLVHDAGHTKRRRERGCQHRAKSRR